MRPAGLVENPAAPVALQDTLPPFDRDQGDKEEAQIVVQPFKPGGGQTAARADPRLIIDIHFSGLYPANEDEGPFPPLLAVIVYRSENHVTTNRESM